MINGTLWKRELKGNFKLVLIFVGVLTMYASMIVAMYDPELGESLELMAQSMPELFAAFGMLEVGATLIEFLSNYLYGFLLVVFPAVYIILLSNKLMARYIDRGSMAYLLATPNKRSKIAWTQASFLVVSTLVLAIYVAVLCIIVSEVMFPGELDIGRFLLINVGLYGVHIFFSGICFFASSVFKDTKFSYGVGSSVVIASILIQMVSQVGEKMENLKYLTPLSLFDTKGLIAGESQAIGLFVVLYGIGFAFFFVSVEIFKKRDLSL